MGEQLSPKVYMSGFRLQGFMAWGLGIKFGAGPKFDTF